MSANNKLILIEILTGFEWKPEEINMCWSFFLLKANINASSDNVHVPVLHSSSLILKYYHWFKQSQIRKNTPCLILFNNRMFGEYLDSRITFEWFEWSMQNWLLSFNNNFWQNQIVGKGGGEAWKLHRSIWMKRYFDKTRP